MNLLCHFSCLIMDDLKFSIMTINWKLQVTRSLDCKRTSEEIKYFLFKTLYFWTVAFVSPLVISYHDFLFYFLLLTKCFLLYTSYVLGGCLRARLGVRFF